MRGVQRRFASGWGVYPHALGYGFHPDADTEGFHTDKTAPGGGSNNSHADPDSLARRRFPTATAAERIFDRS